MIPVSSYLTDARHSNAQQLHDAEMRRRQANVAATVDGIRTAPLPAQSQAAANNFTTPVEPETPAAHPGGDFGMGNHSGSPPGGPPQDYPSSVQWDDDDPGPVNFLEDHHPKIRAALRRAERFAKWLRAVYGHDLENVLYACWRRHHDVVMTIHGLERAYRSLHAGDNLLGEVQWWYYYDIALSRLRNSSMRKCKIDEHKVSASENVPRTTAENELPWFLENRLVSTFTWPSVDELGRETGPIFHLENDGLHKPDLGEPQ